MTETILELPFMGMRVGALLKTLFDYDGLQLGITALDEPVQYILRGELGVVNQMSSFLGNAYVGSASYNTQSHTFSVTNLDGPIATIQICDLNEFGSADLEDTFPLTGGNGSYVFDIPIPGRYLVVIWGQTRCKTLMVEA